MIAEEHRLILQSQLSQNIPPKYQHKVHKQITSQQYTIQSDIPSRLINQQPMSSKQLSKKTPKTKPIAKSTPSKNGTSPEMIANPKQMDPRFSKASYDPKFMAPSSKIAKVKIDKRFSKMLNDSEFNATSTIDRYGRKLDKKKGAEQLKEYYYMDEEENQVQQEEREDIPVEEDAEEESYQAEDDEEHQGIREWMENYNEESSQLEDIDLQDLQGNDIDEVWSDQSENVVKGTNVQATKRLALCNYDWMNITAKDLMILFNSFKQKAGYIKNIKVYMSNIGKQKLEEEEKHGPVGIWKDSPNQEQEEKEKKGQWRKSWKDLLKERQQGDGNGFDETKLRRYQKQRLKYFYAVIQCDSKHTADEIYKQCDGNQFENSNIQFDLRFIPDEIEFDPSNLKEECNEIPVGGEIKNFINRALGHSKVSLSWEDPELSLAASLKKKNWNKMSEAELQKIDWGEYINDQDIDQEDQRKKLAQYTLQEDELIPDWRKTCNKKYRKNDDIEITFEGGFDTKNKPKVNEQKEEVPSLNKQKKSMKERKREHLQEKRKKREQLELLVDDKKNIEAKVDLHDQRFAAVYQNPMYAIDPVDPHFDHRRTGQVFAQVVKRNKNKNRQ